MLLAETAETTAPGPDWVLIWAMIAGVAGIVALVGVIYAARSYYRDHPKRQLEYTVTSRRLMQAATAKFPVEVRVGDVVVPDPYFVEFRMVSNSRADIPSTSFDSGKGITVRFEPGGGYAPADDARGGIEISDAKGNEWKWAEFKIAPQLIRRGSTLALDLISSGKPGVTVNDRHMIDVPVLNVTKRPRRGEMFQAWGWVALSGFILLVTAMTPITAPDSKTTQWLTVTLIILYGGLFIGSVVYLIRQLRWRKRSR